nr:retinol dehydrogenase 12-like [Penaeus vannamei]XP_027218188.1 retinol dehydrogenase 12-like [Penaeus vannamei]
MQVAIDYLSESVFWPVTLLVVPPWSFVWSAVLGVVVWVVNRVRYPWCRDPSKMLGKTVIITGANKGIGLETARELVTRGATVVIACRSMVRGNVAKDDILKGLKGNVSGGAVELAYLDVSCMASVRKFAAAFQGRKIDVLINNAAVADLPQQLTDEGLELTVATNHLGPFLLTHLLMPGLIKAGGRVINVASTGHHWIKKASELDLEGDMKFEFPRPLRTLEIYVVTKLMNVIFTMELHRKLRGTGVTTNCLHPGVVNTDIFDPMVSHVWYGIFIRLYVWAYAKTKSEGAQTSILVAASEDLKDVSGKYFEDCKESKPSPLSQDEGLAKKLWEISERLVQLQPHERTI